MQDYDYRQNGAYFITICTHQRALLFGEVLDDTVQLNSIGEIAQNCWEAIPQHFRNVELDAFVIMPNHIHAIMMLIDPDNKPVDQAVGARHASPLQPPPNGATCASLGAVIGSFKSAAAKAINEHKATPRSVVWQRGYYDHIIRSEKSLNAIREYILYNPARWAMDENNPSKAE